MLAIYYDESTPCIIRPTPLISITQNVIRNKAGMLGSYYDITLNGTILPYEGSPFYVAGNGSSAHNLPTSVKDAFQQNYARPGVEAVDVDHAMSSIIHKQNMLRELFKRDGQLVELLPVSNDTASESTVGTDNPILKFHPTVQSISFEEGQYITNCKYTVNLRAEVLLDNSNKIIISII